MGEEPREIREDFRIVQLVLRHDDLYREIRDALGRIVEGRRGFLFRN